MIKNLEERLDYRFQLPALLEEALTHPSVSYERKGERLPHNQRLEFLGDAVLQLIFTEALYQTFPNDDEGVLTKLRTRMVQTTTLARIARTISLGDDIQLGKGEEANGGRKRDSILADAVEAVIGALFIDGSIEVARRVVLHLWKQEFAALVHAPVEMNPKGELQEILQDYGGFTPIYTIVSIDGPDHDRHFHAIVTWQEIELGKGSGRSKKEAQIKAARQALDSDLLREIVRRESANVLRM